MVWKFQNVQFTLYRRLEYTNVLRMIVRRTRVRVIKSCERLSLEGDHSRPLTSCDKTNQQKKKKVWHPTVINCQATISLNDTFSIILLQEKEETGGSWRQGQIFSSFRVDHIIGRLSIDTIIIIITTSHQSTALPSLFHLVFTIKI